MQISIQFKLIASERLANSKMREQNNSKENFAGEQIHHYQNPAQNTKTVTKFSI